MAQLRHLSSRPGLVVDQHGQAVLEPETPSFVGKPANFGRNRLIYALPLACGPWLMRPPTMVRDSDATQVADPDNTLIGKEWVWIPRMLTARWTEDTRRIGG
jgi:hypothetical protein